jgi:hypothetical protein
LHRLTGILRSCLGGPARLQQQPVIGRLSHRGYAEELLSKAGNVPVALLVPVEIADEFVLCAIGPESRSAAGRPACRRPAL